MIFALIKSTLKEIKVYEITRIFKNCVNFVARCLFHDRDPVHII